MVLNKGMNLLIIYNTVSINFSIVFVSGVASYSIICSATLFDPITTSYWNSVKSKEITEGIFNYKLKRYGHCVTFKKKGKSLIL